MRGDRPVRVKATNPEEMFRLRHLGIGFVWAWIYGCYETDAVFPSRMGIGINADATWLVSATMVVAVLFVGGAALGQRNLRHPARMGIAAGIVACLGTLTPLIQTSSPGITLALQMVSGIASGYGTGILVLLWGQALASLEEDRADIAIPASSLVMIVCALVLPYLSGWVGVVAVASLPIFSGCFLAATIEEGQSPQESSFHEMPGIVEDVSRLSAILRLSVILFLSYAVLGCAGAIQGSASEVFAVFGVDLPTLFGSGLGLVLALCFVFSSLHYILPSAIGWRT